MIKRIVKLTIREECCLDFTSLFNESKEVILNFRGCRYVECLQSTADNRIFFTYSHWDREEDLNRYRHSDTFRQIWSRTKALFDDAPEAWSTSEI